MALVDRQQYPVRGRNRLLAVLIGGDVLALLAFAAIGRSSHGADSGFGAVGAVAGVALPFILGWLLAAPLLGLFRPEIVARPASVLQRVPLACVIAVPLGLGLRALFLQRGIPISFALVTAVTIVVIMLLWRGGFAWWQSRAAARSG